MHSLWHVICKIFKNVSIGGVIYEIWQFEWELSRNNTLVQHGLEVAPEIAKV